MFWSRSSQLKINHNKTFKMSKKQNITQIPQSAVLGTLFRFFLEHNRTNLSMTIIKCSAEEVMLHCVPLETLCFDDYQINITSTLHSLKAKLLQKYLLPVFFPPTFTPLSVQIYFDYRTKWIHPFREICLSDLIIVLSHTSLKVW